MPLSDKESKQSSRRCEQRGHFEIMKEREDSLSKLVGWLLEVPPNESRSVPRGSLRQI